MYSDLDDAGLITSRNVFYLAEYEVDFPSESAQNDIFHIISEFGGCTINHGLFRFHTLGSSFIWTKYVTNYFADHSDAFYCFGFDWMGRQFAMSTAKKDVVYMFDPATVEVFVLNQNLKNFLFENLLETDVDSFEKEYFNVLNANKNDLAIGDCYGYTTPLFLGGGDEMANISVTDMEVYWEINFQLYNKIKNLPIGTKVNKVTI